MKDKTNNGGMALHYWRWEKADLCLKLGAGLPIALLIVFLFCTSHQALASSVTKGSTEAKQEAASPNTKSAPKRSQPVALMGPATPESWKVKAIPLGALLVFAIVAVLLIPCTRAEDGEETPMMPAEVPPMRKSQRITRFQQMLQDYR